MKVCLGCGRAKPLDDYSPLKSGKDGKNPRCKSCRSAGVRSARAADPEKFRSDERVRLDKNPEARAEKRSRAREWYAKNHEAKSAKEAERYRAKRDKILAQKAEYRSSNKSKILVLNGARRAAERRAMPYYADRDAMAAFYAEAKRLTIETGIPHHVDHIFPLRHVEFCGLHAEWNMQIITAEANMKKSNKAPL